MSRSRKKVKPLRCRWCGRYKRRRFPERAECDDCTGRFVGEEKRRRAEKRVKEGS